MAFTLYLQALLEKILVTNMPDYFKYKTPITINVGAAAAVFTTAVRKNILVQQALQVSKGKIRN